MTGVVPSLGSLQEMPDDTVPFTMPDASLFDDSLDEDFHNKVLGTLTTTTSEPNDKPNLDDSLCFDEETQLPAPQAEQDDLSHLDKPSPVHHVPSPALNLNDSIDLEGDGAVPKSPDTLAQEKSSHAFTPDNLVASATSPVDELFPETLNETTNTEEKECIPATHHLSQTSSDKNTSSSPTPKYEDTRSEGRPASQENSFVKVVPSFGKRKKGFVPLSVKSAPPPTTKSHSKPTHESHKLNLSTDSPSLAKPDDNTDAEVPGKQGSTSNKENKLPTVQKPRFAAPKSNSQQGEKNDNGENSAAKEDLKLQAKTKAGQDLKEGAKQQKKETKKMDKDAKQQEKEAKKQEQEQKRLQKEQLKLEKEQKKAEKERLKEEKRLEQERKKAEREQNKKENELKKMEREEKKAQKRPPGKKSQKSGTPAEKSSASAHEKDDNNKHKDPMATDDSSSGECIDDSDGHKEPTAVEDSNSGGHKEPTATDDSNSGGHREPTAAGDDNSGGHREPTAAGDNNSGGHREPTAADNSPPTGSKQDRETSEGKEESLEDKMDTGVSEIAEKRESIPSREDSKTLCEGEKDDVQNAKDSLSGTDNLAKSDSTSMDIQPEAPTPTVDCKDASESKPNCMPSSNLSKPSCKQSNVTDEKKSSQVKKPKPKAPIKKAPKEKPQKKQKEKGNNKKPVESGKRNSSNVQQKSKASKKTSLNSATKNRKRKATDSSGTDSRAESDSDLLVSEPQKKRSKPTNYSGPVWVQCENPDCNKWRELKDCLDPSDIPEKWVCSMNTDLSCNSCSIPEDGWSDIGDSQEFVESPFIPGSIVWARMDGYPWWPAMVEEDPDEEAYYEMGRGSSTVPVKYHVVFFDTPVCRAWVSCIHIQSYSEGNNLNEMTNVSVPQKYKRGLKDGLKQAKKALTMSLTERIAEFTFAKRYRKKGASRKRNACEDTEDEGSAYTKRTNHAHSGSRKSARLATEDIDCSEVKEKLQQSTQQVTGSGISSSSQGGDGNQLSGDTGGLQEGTKEIARSLTTSEDMVNHGNEVRAPGLAGSNGDNNEEFEKGSSDTEKDM